MSDIITRVSVRVMVMMIPVVVCVVMSVVVYVAVHHLVDSRAEQHPCPCLRPRLRLRHQRRLAKGGRVSGR